MRVFIFLSSIICCFNLLGQTVNVQYGDTTYMKKFGNQYLLKSQLEDGLYNVLDSNRIILTCNYFNGVRIAEQFEFWENSKLKSYYNHDKINDGIKYLSFYESGNIKEKIVVRDSSKISIRSLWSSEMELLKKIRLNQNTGVKQVENYFVENGDIELYNADVSGNLIDTLFHYSSIKELKFLKIKVTENSFLVEYYENGSISEKGHIGEFKIENDQGETITKMGRKGKWQTFDVTGTVISEVLYENGEERSSE